MRATNSRISATALLCASILAACDAVVDRREGNEGGLEVGGLTELVATEELRLGGPEAPEPFAFEQPPEFVVDPSGTLFIVHARRASLAVVDAGGTFLRWIGRRGEGPGEFQWPVRVGLVGDTVWVRDFPRPRITRFSADGTHLGTDDLPFDYGFTFTTQQGASALLQAGRVLTMPEGFVVGPDGPVDFPVLVGPLDGSWQDTLFVLSNPRGRIGGITIEALPESPLFAIGPRGSAVLVAEWADSVPGRVELRRYSAASRQWSGSTLRFPARPVNAVVRDSVIETVLDHVTGVVERGRAAGIPASELPGLRRDDVEALLEFPAYVPPLRRILLGIDGSAWLERTAPPGRWIVLGPRGDPEFELRLPPDARLQHASMSTLWTTEEDDFGVPFLVRWALVRN